MRNSKAIQMDGREVVIKEIPFLLGAKVKQAIGEIKPGAKLNDLMEYALQNPELKLEVLEQCSSLTLDELKELSAADFMNLWLEFEEVNTPFFEALNLTVRRIVGMVNGYLDHIEDSTKKAQEEAAKIKAQAAASQKGTSSQD